MKMYFVHIKNILPAGEESSDDELANRHLEDEDYIKKLADVKKYTNV